MKVLYYPNLRKVYIYPGKIAAPTLQSIHTELRVKYRTSTSEFALMMIVGLLSSTLLLPYVGGLILLFLIPYIPFVLYASKKKKEELLDQLMRDLPEHLVIDVVRRGYSECLKNVVDRAFIETSDLVFEIICRHSEKCIDYYSHRIKAFSAIALITSPMVVFAYAFATELLPAILMLLTVTILVFTKLGMCKHRTIKPITSEDAV